MKALKILLLLIIILFSCDKKESKSSLSVKLFPTLFYDSSTAYNFFIICEQIENKSANDLYTLQPRIVVYNAKHKFNYESFYSELKSDGVGLGKYDHYFSNPFYSKNPILENPDEQAKNEKLIDSFILFRNKLMNRKIDSLDASFQKTIWIFIKAHTKIKKYYIIELGKLWQDDIDAIRLRTLHPSEQKNYIIENTKRNPMPDSFCGYKIFKERFNIDSVTIPILCCVFPPNSFFKPPN